jgi:hypothetical protein
MAYTLKTVLGNAIDGARTYTGEPAIGIIKKGSRLPPVLLAWNSGGGGRVAPDLCGLPFQAIPYRILGVGGNGDTFPDHSEQLWRCSVCDRAPFWCSCQRSERHACWPGDSHDGCSVLSDKLLVIPDVD